MPETAPAPLPVIESARLRLRELRVEDADALFALFSDPEVMRYWSRGPWTERAEALEHIERMNHGRAEVEFYPWAIARLEDDGLVGTASLFEIARANGFAGGYVELVQRIAAEAARVSGRTLPLNATGAIGALVIAHNASA